MAQREVFIAGSGDGQYRITGYRTRGSQRAVVDVQDGGNVHVTQGHLQGVTLSRVLGTQESYRVSPGSLRTPATSQRRVPNPSLGGGASGGVAGASAPFPWGGMIILGLAALIAAIAIIGAIGPGGALLTATLLALVGFIQAVRADNRERWVVYWSAVAGVAAGVVLLPSRAWDIRNWYETADVYPIIAIPGSLLFLVGIVAIPIAAFVLTKWLVFTAREDEAYEELGTGLWPVAVGMVFFLITLAAVVFYYTEVLPSR